jgi:hypothetical protein
VPIGKVCVALYSRNILIERQTKKPSIHQIAVLPLLSLALARQDAKPTSNKPAMIKRNQFMKEKIK